MNLVDIYRAVQTSRTLEKMAADDSGAVRDAALTAKVAIDDEIFDHIKTAMSPLSRKILKGALVAGAASAPIGAAGYALMDKADETSSLLQNRVLQTALALAGVGAGLYGLHKMTENSPKTAADENALLQEATDKFATISMIDETLERLPADLSEEATKLAAEIRALNRGYGVQLLSELAG